MITIQFTIYCETCQTSISGTADPHKEIMAQAILCAMQHRWYAFTTKDETLNCNETQFWCSEHKNDIREFVQGVQSAAG